MKPEIAQKGPSENHTVFAIFTKIPINGITVKSRLQETTPLSHSQTEVLAKAFIVDTTIAVLGSTAHSIAFISDPLIDKPSLQALFAQSEVEHKFCSTQIDFYAQKALPFGPRLQTALEELAVQYKSSIVLVGTDTPTISVEMLTRAKQIVETGSYAIGPSSGGGFYLIGLPAQAIDHGFSLSSLFSDPQASELQRLCEVIVQTGSRFELLAPQFDIDTHEDLVTLIDMLAALNCQSSSKKNSRLSAYPKATAKAIDQLEIRVLRNLSNNRGTKIEI